MGIKKRIYFTTFSILELNNSKTTHQILTNLAVLENIDQTFLRIFQTHPHRPCGRRGSLNVTNVTTLLRLPRRPRGRSEEVVVIVNKRSFIYIFQKGQVCQDLMCSF